MGFQNKVFKKYRGEVMLFGILLLFFITDFLNVVLPDVEWLNSLCFIKLSAFSRGGVLLAISFWFAIENFNRLSPRLFIVLLIFMAVPVINIGDGSGLFSWILRFGKYVFPFVLFWLFRKFDNLSLLWAEKFFVVYIISQVLTVTISFIFDIDLFRAYNKNRFGYSGLILAVNEASFFYVLAGVFALFKWNQTNKNFYLLLLFGVLVGSVLLGAKVVFLFLGSCFLYYLIFYWRRNKIFLITSGIGLFLLIGILHVYFNYFEFFFGLNERVGWIGMLTSTRSMLFAERVPEVLESWNIYNFLFGGVNPSTSFVEMDLVDLFLFGGIVGSGVYYFVLFKYLFRFSRGNHLGWFLVTQYFLIGGLAGHVFASGINGTYLALVCVLLQRSEASEKELPFRLFDQF